MRQLYSFSKGINLWNLTLKLWEVTLVCKDKEFIVVKVKFSGHKSLTLGLLLNKGRFSIINFDPPSSFIAVKKINDNAILISYFILHLVLNKNWKFAVCEEDSGMIQIYS